MTKEILKDVAIHNAKSTYKCQQFNDSGICIC